MINKGEGDNTKKSKGKLTEPETKELVSTINEKYGKKIPTPEGVDTGSFSEYVIRGNNRLQEGGAVPVYKPAKGVSKNQFENYTKQIQKKNPGSKARFEY